MNQVSDNMNKSSLTPNIKLVENNLIITEFPIDVFNRVASGESYNCFLEIFAIKHPSRVHFELTAVTSKDIHVIAFLDSCANICAKYNIPVCVDGVTDDLGEMLNKIGFHETCSGKLAVVEKSNHISFFIIIGDSMLKLLNVVKQSFGFVGELFLAVLYSIRHPKKVQWRETFYYMDKTGADAVPIVILICFLMGAILAFQGVVQMGRFGLTIYVANLVGLAITKELGPLMVAIICIGRAGSAFAAEIGTMKVSEELDAMQTMGLSVTRFLVIPKMIALICVMPLLTIVGDVAGIIGGMVVSVTQTNMSFFDFYYRTIAAITPMNIFEGVIKTIVFAALIAGVGCLRGFEAANDAKGVGKASTSAVVSGIFLIVIADAILTALFN